MSAVVLPRGPVRLAVVVLLWAVSSIAAVPLARGDDPTSVHRLEQVGFLPLPGFNADVWAHRGFGYVGTWGSGSRAPATGVRIIDLAEPSAPKLAGAVAAIPGTSQEDVVVASIDTAFFQGDLLAVGIQATVRTSNAPRGVDLWDVTDPRRPQHLAFWPSGPFSGSGARGVHELYLFQRDRRAFVAAAVPFSESIERQGDFRLVEVTNPRAPRQVSHWGATADARLTPGSGQSFFCHSAWANAAGTVAILSYWDAGAILLDISEPTSPRFLGRTIYPPGSDGDTHSIWLARGETLLLTADEDENVRDGTWGFLRIWNIEDTTNPIEIGRFATPNTTKSPPARPGTYCIHNPFVLGDIAYLSWYSDGIRIVDISEPRSPRELAAFVPPAAADPFGVFATAPMVWGVFATGDGLVLGSDINAGLYVLRHVRP